MNRVLELAIEVVSLADREHPADVVLREKLRRSKGLTPVERTQISHAVFAYHRWYGWLDRARGLGEQIEEGLDVDAAFASKPESFSDAELIHKSIPGWVSEQVEVSGALVRVWQTRPALWLRARPGEGRKLAVKLGDAQLAGADFLADALRYIGAHDLFRTEEFHGGEFEVQDLASQAVGWVCGPEAGEVWWDACAGEGGKTLHLSDLMGNKGLIWASDRADWRLKRLKRRAARARVFNYRTVQWDGGAELPTRTRFDGVLLDAPCSGIGTWQRNPQARWTTRLEDVGRLSEVQLDLLGHVSGAVKPGGKLVYAVCTLSRAETMRVVAGFEASHPEFVPLAVEHPLERSKGPGSVLQIWPHQFGCNGMFIAIWARRGG